jgi:hypothetical protein
MSEYKLTADTTMEKIRKYYLEGADLSPHQEKIRVRLEAAHALILDDHNTDKQAADIMSERFNIHFTQAYKDIANAKNLFGDLRKANKEGLRYMVTQWAVELFQMAKTAKDLKGMEKALERITKANNLDSEDQDIPDPSKIQPPVQLLSIDFNFINSSFFDKIDPKAQEELRKLNDAIQAIIARSPVKNYLDNMNVIDIEHREITDGD